MKHPVSTQTLDTGQEPTANGAPRTIRLTEKGREALEHARRKRLYPELDPENDWVEVPVWMLNGQRRDNIH
jgi:DNA-binding PadR family transcriptional regulator